MALKPGSNQDFGGSMAEAIEKAFNQLLQKDGKDPLPIDPPTAETQDRRRLFAAIAQGVVAHLRDNPDAFQILDLNTPTERIRIQAASGNMVV